MRKTIALLAAGISTLMFAGESQAQVRPSGFKLVPGYQGTPRWVSPYVGTPFYNSTTFVTPYGSANLTNFGTTARPVYSGPYHTIYFDSQANTYRYTSGYMNTPNVSSTLTVNPNLYASPYLSPYLYGNPYLSSPYLYGNPYLGNPYLP
jgi:hypothetical protein